MRMVRCTYCGQTYDLTRVEVIARYSDCTVFYTPCCHREADDRSWKGIPDFTVDVDDTFRVMERRLREHRDQNQSIKEKRK